MTHFGITTDYEYTGKRDRIEVWEGSFMSSHTATGYSLPKGDGYMLTDYNGDKIRVECPTPRTGLNYLQVDHAINEALNAHYASNGSIQLSN